MAVYVRPEPSFRRAYVQPVPRRWFVRRLGLLAHLGALLAAVSGAVWSLQALSRADVLRIDTITVAGNRRLSAGEVAGLVGPLRGENLLVADLEAGRASLLASGWIRDAALRRVLPSGLHITLSEREPVGLGRIASRLYLVDETGYVIDEYGPRFANLDLPVIDGLSGGAGASDIDARRAALAAALLTEIRAHGQLAERVSQVDVANPHDAVVLLNGDPVRIHLGERDFAGRLRRYLDVAAVLREAVPDIDYVDVRFDRKVYVGPGDDSATARRVARRSSSAKLQPAASVRRTSAARGATARTGLAAQWGQRRQRGT
jgi:cell division septal protein FtsQ